MQREMLCHVLSVAVVVVVAAAVVVFDFAQLVHCQLSQSDAAAVVHVHAPAVSESHGRLRSHVPGLSRAPSLGAQTHSARLPVRSITNSYL